jgi:hypothetical protein
MSPAAAAALRRVAALAAVDLLVAGLSNPEALPAVLQLLEPAAFREAAVSDALVEALASALEATSWARKQKRRCCRLPMRCAAMESCC